MAASSVTTSMRRTSVPMWRPQPRTPPNGCLITDSRRIKYLGAVIERKGIVSAIAPQGSVGGAAVEPAANDISLAETLTAMIIRTLGPTRLPQ